MNIILCGMSSSGKDTIQKILIEKYNYKPLISYTSRPKRENETNGKEYNFISKDEFINMINNNELVEYRSYNTLVNNNPDIWYYGIKKEELSEEKYVVILDLEGTKSFINYYGDENWCVIYIGCEDETRKKRAMSRGSFDETEWNRRLKDDKIKFSPSNIKEISDFMILNNDGRSIESVTYEVFYCADIQTKKEWFRNNKKEKKKEVENIENFIKEKEIKKIFLDIDGVVIHSCQAMVDLLNEKYNTNLSGEDILSWNFKEVVNTLTDDEIEYLFTTDKFFEIVKPISGAIEFINKHKENVILITKGGLKNITGKKQMFELWGLDDIDMIGLPLHMSKRIIDMTAYGKSLFIDDSTKNLIESNADYRIQFREYKDDKKREWQENWDGKIMYHW